MELLDVRVEAELVRPPARIEVDAVVLHALEQVPAAVGGQRQLLLVLRGGGGRFVVRWRRHGGDAAEVLVAIEDHGLVAGDFSARGVPAASTGGGGCAIAVMRELVGFVVAFRTGLYRRDVFLEDIRIDEVDFVLRWSCQLSGQRPWGSLGGERKLACG